MRNEASARPFPDNLFYDLNAESPTTQAEDFYATFMYVLRVVTDARNARAVILRYKEGKTYDELGDALGVSKQRAQIIIQTILDSITGEHILMLQMGIKGYYEHILDDRIHSLSDVIEQSEREQIAQEAYDKGYRNGFDDGMIGKQNDTANIDLLSTIHIDTLPLSVRTYNALQKNGIRTLGDILMVGDGIINFTSFGKMCFSEIANVLETYNVNIKSTFPKACIKWEI